RDHFAGLRIEYVEDAVLRRMHHDVPLLAVDEEIGRRDLRRAVEVEALVGSLLVVPHVLAGLGIQSDDRGREQVVTAPGRADLGRPRRAVARADIDVAGYGIIGDAVP